MRWIFILLLLMNVVYFGWEYDQDIRFQLNRTRPVLEIPEAAEKLILIGELGNQPEFKQIDNTAPNADITEGSVENPLADDLVDQLPDIIVSGLENEFAENSCFRFGPIPDEQEINSLFDWFTSRKVWANVFFEEEDGGQLFWIYLSPQRTRDSAIVLLQDLKVKGIDDTRIINKGNLVNAISLGLFSTQAAVNSRLVELKDKGYTPVVVPYSDMNRIYWLDVVIVNSTDIIDEVINGHPSRYKSVPISCEEISNSV